MQPFMDKLALEARTYDFRVEALQLVVESVAAFLCRRLPVARICRRGRAAVVSELLDEVHHHFGLGHRVRLRLRSLGLRLFGSGVGGRFGAGTAAACCEIIIHCTKCKGQFIGTVVLSSAA